MSFYYYTDAVADPGKLARLKAALGVTPFEKSTFGAFWASPVEKWDPMAEVWKLVPGDGAIELGLFGTGDWEWIPLEQVEAVKQKLRAYYKPGGAVDVGASSE